MTQNVTAFDAFCGAGGSSTGLVKAGIEVKYAANHWPLAIETHNTNHPNTEHDVADLQTTHASRFPRTTIAWFSPECQNHSLAKGKKRKNAAQLDLWGEHKIDPAEERSRATMREVVEFSEYHRYEAVIVENVVDIRYWQYYEEWLTAMINLGYEYKVLYLNAQFFGVPQSRDRFYAVFWKRGNKAPNLDYRPPAICKEHGPIHAIQSFKKQEYRWGRYGARRQYLYRCPTCGADVMPFYRPASDVIDWSIPSQKIGEREKPLKDATIKRILAGLRKFSKPVIVDTSHSHAAPNGKVSSSDSPLPTQTTRQTFALVEPFVTSQHLGRDAVRSVDRELPCITTMNNEHQLVIPPPFLTCLRGDPNYPFITDLSDPLTTIVATTSQHYLVDPFLIVQRCTDTKDGVNNPVALSDPLRSIVTVGQHALIQPPFVMSYYGQNPTFAQVNEPLPTMRTVQHEALITPEKMLPECGFRMLEPEELKRGMSFPNEYIILGNKRDQVKQIGHAVACNVARWIGERVVESLS